jgi:hypothetical protein
MHDCPVQSSYSPSVIKPSRVIHSGGSRTRRPGFQTCQRICRHSQSFRFNTCCMHCWSALTQRNLRGGVCCRFEDAASLCRPAKGLLHDEAMDWQWWLAAQAAFHTGDLLQVSFSRPVQCSLLRGIQCQGILRCGCSWRHQICVCPACPTLHPPACQGSVIGGLQH